MRNSQGMQLDGTENSSRSGKKTQRDHQSLNCGRSGRIGWTALRLGLLSAWLPICAKAIIISGTTVTFTAADQLSDNTAQFTSYMNNVAYGTVIIQSGSSNATWKTDQLEITRSGLEIKLEANAVLEALPSGFLSGGLCLLRSTGQSNLKVAGQTGSGLRMHKELYATMGEAEWRHGISLSSCANVTISGIFVTNTGGDGIYLGDANSGTGACTNVTLSNVAINGAARNGLSVISVDGLSVTNCSFNHSQGQGNAAVHGPWAGIDFEPNYNTERLTNIVIDGCEFTGNHRFGLIVSTGRLGSASPGVNIMVKNCVIQGTKGAGVTVADLSNSLNPASQITFQDCLIADQTIQGISITNKGKTGGSLSFINCFLKNNNLQNSSADAPISILATTGTAFTLNSPNGGINFTNCVVEQNRDRSVSAGLIATGSTSCVIDTVTGTIFTSGGSVASANATNITVALTPSTSKSHWKLDETASTVAADSTGSSPGTVYSDPPWISGRIGGALSLSGTSTQYVEMPASPGDLDIGTKDFSVALWFQRFNSPTANSRLVYKGASADYDPGYTVLGSNTSLSFVIGNGSIRRSISTGLPAINQWNHLVCTVERGGAMKLYLNGALKSQLSITDWVGTDINSIRHFLLGSCFNFTTLDWPGSVDDVRVYHRALPSQEVAELFRSPSAHWRLNESTGTLASDCTGRTGGTGYGSPLWVTGKIGNALSFSGSGQYVDVALNSSDLNLGKSDYTFTCWFQRFSNPAPNSRLYYKGASADYDPGFAIMGSNSSISAVLCNGLTRRTISGSITGLNQWNHLACVLTRSGTMALYVNGVLSSQIDISDWASTDIASIQHAMLARCYGFTTLDWPGLIDDVRVYKRALSQSEVKEMAEAYTN